MVQKYTLVFDQVIIKQLKKSAKDKRIKDILTHMLDKLEIAGPYIGKLLDSQLFIYELKNKHPPIRLYFKYVKEREEVYVFEFEMKTSEERQRETIKKLKQRLKP
ncbi:MAG: hypothetical protein V1743_01955 [Nanoarchaeota archaeon]